MPAPKASPPPLNACPPFHFPCLCPCRYVSGALLCINVACQFSRTKGEKELIGRVTWNGFMGVQ